MQVVMIFERKIMNNNLDNKSQDREINIDNKDIAFSSINRKKSYIRRKKIVVLQILLISLTTLSAFIFSIKMINGSSWFGKNEDIKEVNNNYNSTEVIDNIENTEEVVDNEDIHDDLDLDNENNKNQENDQLVDETKDELDNKNDDENEKGDKLEEQVDEEQPDEDKPSNESDDNTEDESDDTKKDDKEDSAKTGKYADKTVYLTFDDGPSYLTENILDILDDYDVKATFFVVGKEDEYSLKMYKEIVDRGHSIGMHSYSHKYSYIYNSLKNFKKDFNKIQKLIHDTTGVKPMIYRFPGGSLNDVSKMDIKEIIRFFNKEKIAYYDWNVLNGDAERVEYTNKELINNVISGIEARETSIVLMHDSEDKASTVKTLPKIIDKLITEGATILPLDSDSPKIQMIQANSVK